MNPCSVMGLEGHWVASDPAVGQRCRRSRPDISSPCTCSVSRSLSRRRTSSTASSKPSARRPEPEDLAPHRPQFVGTQFEPDHEQEQEHHHAQFREMQYGTGIGEEAEDRWPDQHASREVAENRSQPQPAEQRHRDDGGRHQGDRGSNRLPKACVSHDRALSLASVDDPRRPGRTGTDRRRRRRRR